MRALSIVSVSRAIVIVPASTSVTNCLIMSRPRSRAGASMPNRPLSTIWSSKLSGPTSAAGCCDCSTLGSAIATSCRLRLIQLRLEFFPLVFVPQRGLKDLFQLLVALDLASQVRQLVAQVEQLLQRLDFLGHAVGREVRHALEREIDADLPGVRVIRQLVVHGHVEMGLHAAQDIVEVVERDFDELSVLQLGKLFSRMTGEIREHAHDERKLADFYRAAGLNLVGDVHAWRPHALEFLVDALF